MPQLAGTQLGGAQLDRLDRFSCILKFKFQMSKCKMENKAYEKNILKLPFIFSLKLAHCPN